ncbi:MAG: hypothetical protein ACNA8H_03390 [Anaerolineales bacterium]
MEIRNNLSEKRQFKFRTNQVAIILLTLLTAGIHGIVLNIQMQTIDPLFTLNALGYLALLAALYLPLPIAKDNRPLVRWIFIGYTVLTVLVWVAIGDKSWPGDALGYITKLIEVFLILLLWLEGRTSSS